MKLKILVFLFVLIGISFLVNIDVLARDGGPAAQDPDVNIRLRGWNSTSVSPNSVIPHPENTDTRQPQLSSTFGTPSFAAFYQLNTRTGSGTDGSPAGFANIRIGSGSDILAPVTGREIGGGFNYTILYATATDIVLHNGTEDSVVSAGGTGYTIHFLDINVNPELLALYNQNEADGRTKLLAIPCRYLIGSASGDPLVSMRDSGSFMDIRFEDWWGNSSANCEDVDAGFVGPSKATEPRLYDLSNEIPCTEVVDPEFHSLRPYPANPCYKKIEDTTLLCSNDLVVKKSFTLTPDQGACGPLQADGSMICHFDMPNLSSNVAVFLDKAKLPIMGNTEDVPNATWTSPNTNANNLSPAQRMNNYVSWYLNGVINRAEADFSSFNPTHLIDFSGPINKLLPWTIQTLARVDGKIAARIASIDNAYGTKAYPALSETSSTTDIRHDQIVGCDYDTLTIPCYIKDVDASLISQLVHLITGTPTINVKRLTSWIDRKPPVESDPTYKTFADFWKAYLTWAGKICSPTFPVIGVYVCSNLQEFWPSAFFPNVPYANTEDRKGQFLTDKDTQLAAPSCKTSGAPCGPVTCANGDLIAQDACPAGGAFASCGDWAEEACRNHGSTPTGNPNSPTVQARLANSPQSDPSVSNVSFKPDSANSDQHSLYFAHMQEDAELGKLLQATFKSQGEANNSSQNSPPDQTAHCEIQNARSNPGDSLYGNINRVGIVDNKEVQDTQVKGTLWFDASFDCKFIYNPLTGKFNSCTKDVFASMSMFTKTPLAQLNWDLLVGGTQSIFKRFFPKIGVDSLLTEIKELPAVTTASYQSTSGDTVLAGDYNKGRPGSDAQMFIPYIGGIQEYFLNGIQTALRPKGMGSSAIVGQNTNTSTPDTGNNNPGQCSPLTYSIDLAGTNIMPKSIDDIVTQLRLVNPGGFGQSTIDQIKQSMETINPITGTTRYQSIIDQSKASGFNSAFVMTVWLEESAGSTIQNSYDWGCGAAGKNDFQGQLSCFLGLPKYWADRPNLFSCGIDGDGQIDFLHFMLFFSQGTCNTITALNNQFCGNYVSFPTRINNFYNLVKQ